MGRQPKAKQLLDKPVKRKTKEKQFRILLTNQKKRKDNGVYYVRGGTVIDGKRVNGKNLNSNPIFASNNGGRGYGAMSSGASENYAEDPRTEMLFWEKTRLEAAQKLAAESSGIPKEDANELQMDYGDGINHPPHYCESKAKCREGHSIECIDITRHLNFNIGNAIKYLWRCDHKGAALDDLKKAAWYIDDEIKWRETK